MANDVRNDNFIFPSRHVPDCFINSQVMNKLDTISNTIGNIDNIIGLSYEKNGNSIKEYKGYSDAIYGHKKGTEPIKVNISKPNGGNRFISVANPLALIPLDFYLMKNASDILSEQLEPNDKYYSSSSYDYDEEGIIVGYTYDGDVLTEETEELVQRGFDNKELITHNICSGRYYHMSIDVSNFFNSIYSHSISWDLVNSQNKDIFENLDVLSRTLNRNETKGIIIGPYTSGIISEIILSKIDRQIVEKYKDDDVSFVHFCDDYDFFSDSKEKLESEVKNFIGKCFLKYGLDLNLSKFKIEEFPFISLKNIQTERIYILKDRIKEEDFDTPLDYVENVMNDLSSSLKIKYSNCNYMISILNSLYEKDEIPVKYLDKETSKILLDYLINMMFKNNLISKASSNLIINIFEKMNFTQEEKNAVLNKWINKRNSCEPQLKEITDLWLQYIILKLKCSTDEITEYMSKLLGNGILQDVMCLDYFSLNSLSIIKAEEVKKYLDHIKDELINRFDNNWKQAAYDTKYWLIFYTNSLRWKFETSTEYSGTLFDELNIHTLASNPSMPGRLKMLDILYVNDVEFYENENSLDIVF